MDARDGTAPEGTGAGNRTAQAQTQAEYSTQSTLVLPDCIVSPKRGRPSEARKVEQERQLEGFAASLLEINSGLEFPVSARGWCYVLEPYGLTKGDFDRGEKWINDLRKSGALPIGFCKEDKKRESRNLPRVDEADPAEYAGDLIWSLKSWVRKYHPLDFWATKPVYVEILVEKIDLLGVFDPVCRKLRVPITNAGGYADLNTRYDLLRRFGKYDDGRRLALLVFTDHDVGGLEIARHLRSNLEELAGAAGWSPDGLEIVRFGLDYETIESLGLTWIDGLKTGSGLDLSDPDHNDHDRRHVQDYLKAFGPRKVEANALLTRISDGRALCERTLLEYVEPEWVREHNSELAVRRAELGVELGNVLRDWLDGGMP